MIFGNPLYFAITYEIIERNNDSCFGLFNFVIEDMLIPGRKSNWTLDLIFSWLKGNAEELSAAYEQCFDDIKAKDLYVMAARSRGWYMPGDAPLLILKKSEKEIGIEIELAEISDLGWVFFLFGSSGDKERLVYTNDCGVQDFSVYEAYFPQGTIESVIRALPNIKEG